MTSVMQKDEASASVGSSSPETIASKYWKGVLKKDTPNEETLMAYAEVLFGEHCERRRQLEPNGVLNFQRAHVEVGRCAAKLLLEVPLGLPKLRMKLCAVICTAWVYCRADEAEEFSQVVREWPRVENEEVAKTLRDVITSSRGYSILNFKLAEFFAHANLPNGDDAVFRTMFKAVGNNATPSEIALLGKALYVLQRTDHRPAFERLINKAVKNM